VVSDGEVAWTGLVAFGHEVCRLVLHRARVNSETSTSRTETPGLRTMFYFEFELRFLTGFFETTRWHRRGFISYC